ncbi:MAG TPA: response regulator [Verrucomicrobiae bacterium]|jgi:CheY-like chemotaxis protein
MAITQKRILVVDDEVVVCESLKMALESEDYILESANSADEALKKFDEAEFDLVLLDHFMAGTRGAELAQTLKARNNFLPVLMLTGTMPDRELPAVDLVLLKPFELHDIRTTINKMLHEPCVMGLCS